MAFTVDVRSAFVFVVTIPVLCVVVFGIMAVSMPLYKSVQRQLDKVLLTTRENLLGVRVIRAFNRQKSETEKFDRENREALDKISEFLIEKETITGKEFMKILRKVQGIEESEELETKKEARIAMKPVEEPEEGPEFTEE